MPMATDHTPPNLVVVGSYNHGFVMSVPTIPIPGETVLGSEYQEGAGGKGSNQAIGATRLGADVEFVGRIGEDRFGDDAMSLWKDEGVSTTHVDRTDATHTGVGFVVVDENGENAITVAPGANERLDAAAVREAADAIEAADVALCQLETKTEAVTTALEISDQAGVVTVLNPAPARALPADLLARVEYLTPNRTEARVLAGYAPDATVDDRTLCADLLEAGPSTVVLTQGGDGALAVSSEKTIDVEAPDVDVTDTTGAGDAFNAGFSVALGEGYDLRSAVNFGCRVGALACTVTEVVPALPYRSDVDPI